MEELAYSTPASIAEAGRMLAEVEGAVALAGGTDIVVGLQSGKVPGGHMIDLTRLSGLNGIQDVGGAVEIGALATMTDIARADVVKTTWPALAVAAGSMGCWQVRNLATLGGNLCNAAPSADTAPPLVLYGAIALIDGVSGRREVPVADFFTGPGSTVLGRGELLVGVRVPHPAAGFRAAYVRRALRKSMDIPIVNLAVGLRVDNGLVADARIVLGAVAPTPIRAPKAEAVLKGSAPDSATIAAAAAQAAQEAKPITDIRATAEYRAAMVEVFCRRALESLLEREEA